MEYSSSNPNITNAGHMNDLLAQFKTLMETSPSVDDVAPGSLTSSLPQASPTAPVVSTDAVHHTRLPSLTEQVPPVAQKTCSGTTAAAGGLVTPINPYTSVIPTESSSSFAINTSSAAAAAALAADDYVPFYKNPNVLIVGFVVLVILGVAGYFLYKKFFASKDIPAGASIFPPSSLPVQTASYHAPPPTSTQYLQPTSLPVPSPSSYAPQGPYSQQPQPPQGGSGSSGGMSWPTPLPPTSSSPLPVVDQTKRSQEGIPPPPRPVNALASSPQIAASETGMPPPDVEEEENDPKATKLSEIAF